MDNQTYYEASWTVWITKHYVARWKLWITKHIMNLGERYGYQNILWSQEKFMDNKSYYEAGWNIRITKHIMKLGERYG